MDWRVPSLVAALLIIFFSNWLLGFSYFLLSDHCSMNRHFQESTLQLAKAVAQSLSQANVTHWADAGTLLGGAREQDIILHDNDVDIAIWTWDEQKARQAIHDAGLGVFISSLEGMPLMRVFETSFPMDTRFPHVDINQWKLSAKDNNRMLDLQAAVNRYLKDYPVEWLGPNHRPSPGCFVNLGSIRLPAPCETKKWLVHHFGPNCMTKAIPRWQDCKNGITSKIYGYKL